MIGKAFAAMAFGVLPMQCDGGSPAPPPPETPAPECASGIINQSRLPNSYAALCGSGEGWIDVEIGCTTSPGNFSWNVWVSTAGYRPADYYNPNAADKMMANVRVVEAHCPATVPYIQPGLILVSTYK